MQTTITTAQERDNSLDSSKKIGLIVLLALIAIAAAWYYFIKRK